MKQHITIEQLNELSDKGKERLRKWYAKQPYEMVVVGLSSGETTMKESSPLISIGQMIEFLDEYAGDNDFEIRIHSAGKAWKTPGQRIVDINGLPVSEIEDEIELCDALWEVVKELLNKDER